MKPKDKCIYCNLSLRGPGCPYSPSGIHIHPTKNKCIYCGLNAKGKGCQHSPTGIHIQYVDFGMIQAEQASHHLTCAYVFEKLTQSFTDTNAYKLGIINESGEMIRHPETIPEHNSYTPLDRVVFRLKKLLGEKIDLLNTELLVESVFNHVEDYENTDSPEWDPQVYSEQLDAENNFKQSVASLLTEYYNIISEASKTISMNKIDSLLMDILTNDDSK